MYLVDEDGNTLTKSGLPKSTATTTVYTITNNVYKVDKYRNAPADSADERTLLWRAGQQVTQAEYDAAFAAATFTSITPNTGTASGGTATVIKGTNLRGASGVTFGGSAGTAFSVVDEETIHVTTPAHATGAVNVVIQDDAGNVTATGAFTYT